MSMSQVNMPEMPCAPVLELNGQRKRFHVPFGLKPLIELMAREVIKNQPENIYQYLADLLEGNKEGKDDADGNEDVEFTTEADLNQGPLNEVADDSHPDGDSNAERPHRKSWEVHRWSFEGKSILSEHSLQEFIASLRTSFEEATRNAIIIQKAYRGHHDREIVKEIRRSRGLGSAEVKHFKEGSAASEHHDSDDHEETEFDTGTFEREDDDEPFHDHDEDDEPFHDHEDDEDDGHGDGDGNRSPSPVESGGDDADALPQESAADVHEDED